MTLIRKHEIDLIINCSPESCKHENQMKQILNIIEYNIKDYGDFEYMSLFSEIIQQIEKNINENKKILIHCNKGISRAPTLVLAFIMIKLKKRFEDAFSYIRQIYPKADPNIGFVV